MLRSSEFIALCLKNRDNENAIVYRQQQQPHPNVVAGPVRYPTSVRLESKFSPNSETTAKTASCEGPPCQPGCATTVHGLLRCSQATPTHRGKQGSQCYATQRKAKICGLNIGQRAGRQRCQDDVAGPIRRQLSTWGLMLPAISDSSHQPGTPSPSAWHTVARNLSAVKTTAASWRRIRAVGNAPSRISHNQHAGLSPEPATSRLRRVYSVRRRNSLPLQAIWIPGRHPGASRNPESTPESRPASERRKAKRCLA